ncbi:bifunctional cobalt-precorrin-7 (C(5))-methyltransferase/cobalt-precorrin-6B (C(15))-methyltransferase [Thiorhodovibrio frisius]|uniref:Precorrin-6y C5,15-methyltransferase (Decarboxylating) subunit n=1 Tax=Thiorhodovibrio frisius TaxID=631362 RepID=H8Z035_9GAMM|nr:bifunctional cobalt-precorrin-7 (C(5))-methyltransferase/cobalt-precorrin-6B (C(15))-methyltransferase [Thiorhodovibrio frisius]EIC21208.1 precorrin-6y C5,15-methyltransferase (decarboxylating) subunit [Thiorhodovibrio frisius]WPL23784.1 Precorrin-6Y C(5,15)-methyltransferase [decarboxylating] [Thiorhodovibrio frisius]
MSDLPHKDSPSPWLTIIGIGEDGLAGLGEAACQALAQARVVFGGARHLALLPLKPEQTRHNWPSPFAATHERLLAYRGQPVVALASGDPMFHGVGATLAKWFDAAELRVLPAPSAVSLAAARLGWALHEVEVIPAHREPLESVALHLAPSAQLLVLSRDGDTPAQLAELLVAQGYGNSRMVRLERLGGPGERISQGQAVSWDHPSGAALNLVAVACCADASTPRLARRAGLPDSAFAHDGQLTKQDMRAIVLARLAPDHGELLWDVGAGCGSIGIEWLRAGTRCQTIAIESHPERCALIRANRARLGVPELKLIEGRAPAALAGLERPDAIFIGGGLTATGLVEHCWDALKPGGRLLATAVTLESELLLTTLYQHHGGELIRVALAQAGPLGGFQSWEPARPLTLLAITKPV